MRQRKQTKHAKLPESVTATIDKFSHDGRGLARIDGRVLMVEDALPGEQCQVKIIKGNSKLWQGLSLHRTQDGEARVHPECEHYGYCGGCQLQHVAHSAQIQLKQDAIQDHFHRNGVSPEQWSAPLVSSPYQYRHRARLHVSPKGVLGFQMAGKNQVAPIRQCQVMIPALQDMVVQLSRAPLLGVKQVEITQDDFGNPGLAILKSSDKAEQQLTEWAMSRDWTLKSPMRYSSGRVSVYAYPGDFTQVNRAMNEAMIAQSMAWLDLKPTDRLLDLFCGNGNLSLVLASNVEFVLGYEAGASAVVLANEAARQASLSAKFVEKDLFAVNLALDSDLHTFAPTCAILDPPRAGALNVCKALAELTTLKRLLYISCDPATLARDLKQFERCRWRVVKAGLLDMFPQTRHIETMVLLEQP